MHPQIIVIAYNRPESLKRLLVSLANAYYPDNSISLIISIDGDKNSDVKNVAELFNWKFGIKNILVQNPRLGLKKHICSACDNAAEKGSFIVLEDDIAVSPFFYNFAFHAINYYQDDLAIAGVSLYGYSIAESCLLPFYPLVDDADTYFMRFPSSWGQCFTPKQWNDFKKFNLTDEKNNVFLPLFINDWKNNSWKKDFAAYMISKNNFFVFPKISLTTNFSEKGINSPFKIDVFQVPLQLKEIKYSFQKISDSDNIFDEHFELFPQSVKKMIHDFSDIDFAVDIYRTKEIKKIKEKFVLTSRKGIGKNDDQVLGKILYKRSFNDITLCDKNDVARTPVKPDFGAAIYLRHNKGKSNSFLFDLNFFAYRVGFRAANYFHWIKSYFIQ